jgi:hypothetical protein
MFYGDGDLRVAYDDGSTKIVINGPEREAIAWMDVNMRELPSIALEILVREGYNYLSDEYIDAGPGDEPAQVYVFVTGDDA